MEQLTDSLGAATVHLSAEQRARLDEVSRIELSFPHDFLGSSGVMDMVVGAEVRPRFDPCP